MLARLSKFRKFLGPEVWSFFVTSCVIGVAWFAIESMFIFVLEGFLRSLGILNTASSNLGSWYPTGVGAASALLVVFGTVRAGVFVAKDYLINVTQHIFIRYQRSHISQYALSHAEDTSSFQILSLFNETLARAASVVQQTTQLIISSITSVLFLILGLKLAPYELLSGLALLAIFLYPLKFLNAKIDNHGKEINQDWDEINETLITSFRNYNLLKIYYLLEQKTRQIHRSLKAYESHFKSYQVISSSKSAFPLLVGAVIISFITFMSQKYFHTNGMVLLSFFYIFIRLSQSSSEMSVSISNMRLNLPSFKQLYHWNEATQLPVKISVVDPIKRLELERLVREKGVEIKVVDLSFSYGNHPPLFKNMNLSLNQGDCLVIQGASGKGKSTLLTLILGLNKPVTGSVTINGFAVHEVAEALSNLIAYVGPEPFLIKGTIQDNLLYCHPHPNHVTEAACWQALEKAQLKDLVQQIGLHNELNEMTPISTGQKQRLAIARAILREPSLLILDEATANLDHDTEEKFITSLREIIEQMTVVVITHKPTLDRLATQTLKL